MHNPFDNIEITSSAEQDAVEQFKQRLEYLSIPAKTVLLREGGGTHADKYATSRLSRCACHYAQGMVQIAFFARDTDTKNRYHCAIGDFSFARGNRYSPAVCRGCQLVDWVMALGHRLGSYCPIRRTLRQTPTHSAQGAAKLEG